MKPLIFIPPAQAEALSDTQGDLMQGDLMQGDLMQDDLRSGDCGPRQPWRDDDGAEELLPEPRLHQRREGSASKAAVSNAQLWPSSANSSR